MLYKYFKMWTFILIGLNIISMVYGYASGYFPETCGTMLPLHDADPQTSKPPYEVSYQQGHVRDPITVCLSSPTGKDFMGFMLKALDTSKEEGPPLGKFTLLDSGLDQLLTCSGSGGSAVSHKNNRRKTRICVNWTAPQDAGASTTFRATFSETYKTFWTKVDAILPPPTPIPSTLPSTQPSTATSTQPSTATSAQPSTATSAPSSTQPGTSTSTQPSATTSTQPSTATSAPPSTHPGTSTSTQPSTTTSAKPSTHPGTSTSTQPSTTTSAKPSTQPGTATSSPPSTQPGTSTSTQPSATTSTQPSTTTSTHPATSTSTQTSTTTSPHPGTSKSTTISTKPITIITSTATQQADNISSLLEKAGTVKMNVVLFLGVLKMELSNIFLTALSDGPFSRHLNKVSQTFFVVLCGVVETSALALFCLANPINVSLVALVSVAIVFNIIELVIVCLPIGPSHELKEISDHVVKVSSFIHQTFTTAAIFVGILEVDKHKGTRTDSRILKVMVAFTVLLLLFEMWVFISSTQRKAMLRRKTGCPANRERGRPRGKQKKLGAAKGIVIAVSVIFIVAFLCFGVTVAVMILGCHQESGCA
ncbi:uncharacterized protein LOC120824395 isoform X2 [Gasterosteus aculeatus]